MPGQSQDHRNPVSPDERLYMASVRPTTSGALGWSGVRAEHLTAPPDTACEVDVPPTTHHWLVLNHHLSNMFSLQFAGVELNAPPPLGSLTIIPVGCSSQWRWSGAGESTHILVEPQLLGWVAVEALDLNPDRVTLPPVYGLSDPAVQAAMLALDAEMRAGGPGGRLLAESLGNVLAVHLLRRFSASEPTDVHPGGVLSRHKLRAVISPALIVRNRPLRPSRG